MIATLLEPIQYPIHYHRPHRYLRYHVRSYFPYLSRPHSFREYSLSCFNVTKTLRDDVSLRERRTLYLFELVLKRWRSQIFIKSTAARGYIKSHRLTYKNPGDYVLLYTQVDVNVHLYLPRYVPFFRIQHMSRIYTFVFAQNKSTSRFSQALRVKHR